MSAASGTRDNTVYVDNIIATGDISASGAIKANELHTTYTSASIIYESGSTQFGDTFDDLHKFMGNVYK